MSDKGKILGDAMYLSCVTTVGDFVPEGYTLAARFDVDGRMCSQWVKDVTQEVAPLPRPTSTVTADSAPAKPE